MARAFSVRLTASLLVTLALGAAGPAGEKGEKGKDGQGDKSFTAKGEIVLPVHKVKMEKDQLYYIEVKAKGFQPRVVIPGVFLGFGGLGGPAFPAPPPFAVPAKGFFEQPPLSQLPPLPPEIQKAIDKDRPAKDVPVVPPKKEIDKAPLVPPLPEVAAQPDLKVRPVFQPKPPIFQPVLGEFRTTFTPKETKEYQIIVLPDFIAEAPKGKLEYTLTIRQAGKPILNVTDKWTDKDPQYGKRNTYYKAYPIKMKAGETYIIDLVRPEKIDFNLDPYLFLEDKNKQVVAEDDDSGGNLNARIVFTPKTDGEYRIIATTLVPATGGFTLTVRGPAADAATEKK
jgi:hypothetical protein